MTPKDKSKELVKKYACLNRGEIENDWKNRDIVFDSLDIECALILVDEILWMSSHYVTIHFWQEVKREIENL
jgi:hypothetical protein